METRRTFIVKAGAAAVSFPVLARAASFPERAVKLVVPYPAGGAADVYSRLVAGRLEKVLGQPIVFDYRPGGATAIGAEVVARAPADGYTVGFVDSGAFAFVPNMRKVAYDPIKSFAPIAVLGVVPYILAAKAAAPFRDISELLAYAKANPDKLNIASSGVGSAHHLIGELFKIRTRTVMRHVPYKGAAQYLADLASGQVDLAVSSIGPAVPYLQNNRIKVLGCTAAKRSRVLPNVPTIAEQGVTGFDAKPWVCFVAPAAVPAEALEVLRAAFRKTYEDAEVVASLEKQGVEDVGAMTAAQVADQMRNDLAQWGEVIRQANIKLDS